MRRARQRMMAFSIAFAARESWARRAASKDATHLSAWWFSRSCRSKKRKSLLAEDPAVKSGAAARRVPSMVVGRSCAAMVKAAARCGGRQNSECLTDAIKCQTSTLKDNRISVRFSPEMRHRLQSAARRGGRRESDIVRDAVATPTGLGRAPTNRVRTSEESRTNRDGEGENSRPQHEPEVF